MSVAHAVVAEYALAAVGCMFAVALGLWLGLRFGGWHARRSAERRTHERLLRELEAATLEAHIAEHQKLWERDHS